MFNNDINKPAITVFLLLTSAKTSFRQWQKLANPGWALWALGPPCLRQWPVV